jgi:hypothetical protein
LLTVNASPIGSSEDLFQSSPAIWASSPARCHLMKIKLFLVALFLALYIGAWHFGGLRSVQKLSHSEPQVLLNESTFALMTWNIGYFDYESDSRAQDKDLEAIASVIGETGAQVIAPERGTRAIKRL